MTQTPQVGDRITLQFVVTAVHARVIAANIPNAEGAYYFYTDHLAHAKIEPRPLAVGDRVRRHGDPIYGTIEAIVRGKAALSVGGELGMFVALSDLTRIPDQST